MRYQKKAHNFASSYRFASIEPFVSWLEHTIKKDAYIKAMFSAELKLFPDNYGRLSLVRVG